MRPALVIAAYRALADGADGTDGAGDAQGDARADAAVWQTAAAFELLHSAFVVHDDLIDRDPSGAASRTWPGASASARATTARQPTMRPSWAMRRRCSRATCCCSRRRVSSRPSTPSPPRATPCCRSSTTPSSVSAAGEPADVENAARTDVPDTDALLGVAHDKTAAYSFEAPLLAGAALAGASAPARAAFGAAAGDLGLAFQLVDDLIGTFGTRRQAGRAPGADLREAKRTPLIGFARGGDA